MMLLPFFAPWSEKQVEPVPSLAKEWTGRD
jgi:hypothetical protein